MPAKPAPKPGTGSAGDAKAEDAKPAPDAGGEAKVNAAADNAAQRAVQAANAASQAAATAAKAASDAAAAAEKAAQMAQETAQAATATSDALHKPPGEAGEEALPEGVKGPAELEAEANARAAAQLRAVSKFPEYLKAAGRKSDVRSDTRARAATEHYTCCFLKDEGSEDVLKDVVARVMELYDRKAEDVVDEMLNNLRFPEADDDAREAEPGTQVPKARFDNEARLAMLAAAVKKQTGRHSIENPLLQLVLRQATQCGADMDRDLGFDDVPPNRKRMDLPDQIEEWDEYAEEYSDWGKEGRNAVIMTLLGLAPRDTPPEPLPARETPAGAATDTAPAEGAGEKPSTKPGAKPGSKPGAKPATKPDAKPAAKPGGKTSKPAGDDAGAGGAGAGGAGAAQYFDTGVGWDTWLKWACTLWAMAPRKAVHPETGRHAAPSLYYGIGGGRLSKEVVDKHRALTPGEFILWDSPRMATTSKRVAALTARGDAGGSGGSTDAPTEENPGSLIFSIKKCGGLGLTLGPMSHYPEENGVILPPFMKFKVVGNHIDPNNKHGEGLIIELEPEALDVEGLEEFLEKVRLDAEAAALRMHVGQKRRIDGPEMNNTYTYAEKNVRMGGPKHVSLPFDTAWQEMLWVVDRAEGVADDAYNWVGQERITSRPGPTGPRPTQYPVINASQPQRHPQQQQQQQLPRPKLVPQPQTLRPAFSPPRRKAPEGAPAQTRPVPLPPTPIAPLARGGYPPSPTLRQTGYRSPPPPNAPYPPRPSPPRNLGSAADPRSAQQYPPHPHTGPQTPSPSPMSPIDPRYAGQATPAVRTGQGTGDTRSNQNPSLVSSMPGPPGSPNSFFNPASRPSRGVSPPGALSRRTGGFPHHPAPGSYHNTAGHQPPSPTAQPRQPHSARWVHPSAAQPQPRTTTGII